MKACQDALLVVKHLQFRLEQVTNRICLLLRFFLPLDIFGFESLLLPKS